MNELSIRDLSEIIGGQLRLSEMPPIGGDLEPLGRIVIDSRIVKSGDIFLGIKGERFNGSMFAEEAFSQNALGAVVQGRSLEPWAGKFSIEVEDTRWALWRLASWMRRQFLGKVVAVTGSVGKSTTRQMIDTVLSSQLCGSVSPKNYNNQLGVPLSMLEMEQSHDYCVLELGASSQGEIEALSNLCCPHIGVITCIGDAHKGSFGDVSTIAHSKVELLGSLPEEGWGVLNGDDPWLRRIASQSSAKIVWVGRGADCDFVATEASCNNGWLAFKVDGVQIKTPVWGRHHLISALSAYAVGRLMDISPSQIAAALENFEPLPMRCEVIQCDDIAIINDAYNSSPTGMRAALDVLREFNSPGKRIVVCGDMGDLGDESAKLHYQIGDEIVSRGGADRIIACGRYAQDVVKGSIRAGMSKENSVVCETVQESLPILRETVLSGDTVLMKGSREMQMETLVEQFIAKERKMAA